MENVTDALQKEIKRIWPKAKKNISKINKDVSKLLKKSEDNILTASRHLKKSAERMLFKAKREELYYELGKIIAPLLTSDQLKNKNILKISSEIQRINKSLRTKK